MTEDITQRLQKLAAKPDFVDFRGNRIIPQAMSLMFRSETRRCLFWYNPQTKAMAFSTEAKTHLQLDKFPIIKNFREWKRGGMFEKDNLNYILIQAGDFPDGIVNVQMLSDIYHLAESMSQLKISGIVDESGCDLLPEKE